MIDLEPLGECALRAALPEGADARAVLEALRACDGVVDAVVTPTHAAVYFEPGRLPAGIEDAIVRARQAAPSTPREHAVRVVYDGPDLDAVAKAVGLSPGELAGIHQARVYVVKMIGFLPGFAYLGDLDARIAVPRRPMPRPRVDAGSVAIAAEHTGVYPFRSPGGWNLIGRVDGFSAFDEARGATLSLGDRVRFTSAR